MSTKFFAVNILQYIHVLNHYGTQFRLIQIYMPITFQYSWEKINLISTSIFFFYKSLMSRNQHTVDEALNDPKLHFAKLHPRERER